MLAMLTGKHSAVMTVPTDSRHQVQCEVTLLAQARQQSNNTNQHNNTNNEQMATQVVS